LEAVPENAAELLARFAPRSLRSAQPADKLRKLAEVLRLDADGIYLRLVSHCQNPSALTHGLTEHPIRMPKCAGIGRESVLERMQLFDTATYLPDDILQKVDRATMAVSLEVRPPLLDHRVVEFAWTLPRHLRVRNGESKWLLRRVLDRYLPRALVQRPKMGFSMPLARWLRGPLRDWAEDLLEAHHLGDTLIDIAAVRQLWSEHINGRDRANEIWTILMLEAWRRRWTPTIRAERDRVRAIG
jgi:asparagine synthase (glutamine-hydrolysing)